MRISIAEFIRGTRQGTQYSTGYETAILLGVITFMLGCRKDG